MLLLNSSLLCPISLSSEELPRPLTLIRENAERAPKQLFWLSVLTFRLLSEQILTFLTRVVEISLERLLNTSSTPGP